MLKNILECMCKCSVNKKLLLSLVMSFVAFKEQ